MFEMLTADQLFDLHARLFDQATAVHRRMIGPDGKALMSVFSDEWAILSAWHADVCQMQFEVGADLRRRCDEEARADAPMRLSGCTCQAISGSHASTCAWAMNRA